MTHETEKFMRIVGGTFLFFFLLCLLLAAAPQDAQGQNLPTEPTATIYPFVTGQARALLEADWTETPHQFERGYCGQVHGIFRPSEDGFVPGDMTMFIVIDSAVPAHMDSADEHHSKFECPAGWATIHTHPPSQDLYGYECWPSRNDLMAIISLGNQFGIIQCDKHAFRFYFPYELRPMSSGDDN